MIIRQRCWPKRQHDWSNGWLGLQHFNPKEEPTTLMRKCVTCGWKQFKDADQL